MTPDQEFRKLFNDRMDRFDEKLDKVSDDMNSLKIKVAGFSAFIGSIVTVFINYVSK